MFVERNPTVSEGVSL